MSLNNVIREMKNIEQLTCPYYSVRALFSFSLPRAVSKIEIREASCQGCGEVVVDLVLEWFVHRTESEEFLQKIESKTERARKPQSSKK